MNRFRGSDEQVDREVAALERMASTRLRRAAADLAALDRDLRELRKERARRRSAGEVPSGSVPDSGAAYAEP